MPIRWLQISVIYGFSRRIWVTYLAGPVSVIKKAGGIVWSKPIAHRVL